MEYYIHIINTEGYDVLGPFTDHYDVIKTVHAYRQRSSVLHCWSTIGKREDVK